MNTIERNWVKSFFEGIIKLKNENDQGRQPRVEVIEELQNIFASQLFPIARNKFTTRLRRQ